MNRRIRVQNGSTALDYTFDSLNRRVTTWLESTDSGISGKMYWGSSNTPVAYRDGPTHFELQDWLGTERMRTSYTGTVEGSYSSLPFGDGYSFSGADGDAYHFAGLDHDSATDTQHAQFRQYSSTQGHWLSPDPYDGSYDFSNPQSFNRYSYALNNPLSSIDPAGLSPCDLGPDGNCGTNFGGGGSGDGGSGDGDGGGIDLGWLAHLFESLFGLGGPSFHGSLHPDPQVTLNGTATSGRASASARKYAWAAGALPECSACLMRDASSALVVVGQGRSPEGEETPQRKSNRSTRTSLNI